MSVHTARPGSRPRRSPHPATWAVAGICAEAGRLLSGDLVAARIGG